jgi:hypothetical protein
MQLFPREFNGSERDMFEMGAFKIGTLEGNSPHGEIGCAGIPMHNKRYA